MSHSYFSDLLPQLAERSKLATIGQLGFANVPLRRYLAEIFSHPFGVSGSFLGDPTFEAVFGWEAAQPTMGELAGNLLSNQLVNAMHNPPKELAEDYAFKKNWHPHRHQLESWKILAAPSPKSLVVASGTGSGKTECFMVPILDRLVREQQVKQRQLVGVRALFLYPLNALINSQRERLRAWTHAFDGQIRFCLYNGNTPDEEPAHKHRENPCEVIDRKALRSAPPPILVTNSTMLEYMLVRTADAPILRQSQGQLEWIVLDEAHTYIGSQAAELSLLIRRVLYAFGVKPEQVRFVATSATIGDTNGEAGQKLKRFLADVAGIDPGYVYLVGGRRAIPALVSDGADSALSFDELCNIDSGKVATKARCTALSNHPVARRIRNLFVDDPLKSVARLSQVCASFGFTDASRSEQHRALLWLDLLSGTTSVLSGTTSEVGTPFLPLRAHLLHQTLTGLWACADRDCPERKDTALDHEQWHFGKVYLEPRRHCICGSPAYEIVTCRDCGAVYLLAELYGEGFDEWLLQHNPKQAIDEFELESDKAEEEHDDEESLDGNVIPAGRTPVLITNREKSDRTETFDLLRSSRKRVEQTTETLRLIYGDKEFGCLDCNSRDTLKNKVFQSARVGAPFLLGNSLPTLLEFAPDGIKPAEHPYRGRRLLTFNDSRQGTARIAARLQQESERNRVRGLVYHLVLKHHLQQTTQETETARNLKAELNTPGLPESTRRLLEGLLAKEAARYQALGFNALAGQLTSQGLDFSRMLGTYRNFDPEIFGGSSGPLALAKMLLIREFARRPKRSNNLETMGLVAVCYPALDKVVLPGAAKRAGFTLDDWRDFLKICLDFFVRSGGSLEIDRSWRSWLGMPFRQTSLVTRDTEAGRFQRRWPRARRSAAQSTLVRLLAYVLKADIETACSEDHVDDLLSAAWDELTSRDILQLSAGGRLLPTNEMAFKPVETAWICPVTRRILDTTLKGGTPYLPRTAIAATAQCEKTTIPLYDVAFGGEDDELRRIRRARSWIGQQSDLIPLREGGIWTNLNDRVVELAPYFTTAEHSAQQGSALLDGYEKAFKTGDLNLLSCSTTMEMGIDIGGISMVAMNNVPPHPANYLQRAGRAGRRQETRSVAFTLCKANPHDQAVFRNSRWAFDTPLPAPKVSLESKVIVQRHVNSMLLAHFLSQVVDGRQDKTKLTCGWFLADKVDSKAEHYSKWCRNFDPKISPVLVEGLDQLVRHSVYEGHSLTALFQQSAEGVEQIKKAWLGEWDELCRQEKHVSPTGESSPAYKAIQNHKKRMGDEYLLRELATQGFLPGYGFPTHIVTFDNMEISKFKRQLKEKEGREDNRYRRRELPSRDRVTALREYAPGAELVIDGLVYRSAGITLNWHVPASEKEINEIQNIKIAWQCQRCGASGSTRLMQSIQACSACRQPIDSFLEFLEPAGFSVDFYEDIDNDVSTQDFIPVELPWINAQGEWIDLPHPALGRYRATTEGHIFHQSRGLFGKGYAICLACGRSEPLTQDDKPKLLIQPHKRLRGSNKAEDCPGSHEPWKIKQVNALGHEEKTDVLEIQLRDENGLWLTNSRVANTLAVAFRDALAEQLGVQVSELGCGIKQTELADQSICKSIFLYDRFAAGYSSSLAIDSKPGEDGDSIAQLIINAAKKLDCPADCDSVCPQCLLDFDQRFIAEQLDRKTAKQLLNEAWISELQGSR